MLATGNKAYGLEIQLHDDGGKDYHFCELEKIKSTIHIQKITTSKDFDTIRPMLKSDFPLSVIVNGRGVISKSHEDFAASNAQQLFPGVNLQDFYFDTCAFQEENVGYLIRKKTIDDILIFLTQAKLPVIGLSFGLSLVTKVTALLASEIKQAKVQIHGRVIETGVGDKFTDTVVQNKVIIGEDEIPFTGFPSYCAAISYFLEVSADIDNADLKKKRHDFIADKKLSRYALAYLGIILLLLFLGTAVNLYYSSSYQELSSSTRAQTKSADRDSLIAQITRRKEFLVQDGWTGSSRASFYADRLASGVSQGIKLTSIQIAPEKRVKDDVDKVTFEDKLIRVTGISSNELSLKNWLEELKRADWLQHADVEKYEWDGKKQEGGFEVSIILKGS